MKLSSAIENYEALKRSLGAVFSVDAGILRSFSRALGDVCLEAITAEDCRTFCRGKGLPTRFWERKHESLRGFFRYLVSRGILINSPFQDPAPRIQRTFRPHIYSHDELRRLLETAAQERNPRTRLEPETLRTIILLLYGAGLRVGEALRLRPCDVNLQDRVLSVWNTKFFKSRLIPIGAGLAAALARYAQQRQPVRPPDEHPPSFFSTRTGMPIQLWQIEVGFARLRKRAGIRRTSTDRWHPRLHDLRATFAVHCLVAWYREGADLQTRLPLLATYLGHVSVSGTQAYLPMTHELLTEASRRFERYAQRRIPMPDSHLLGSFVRRFLLESVIADRNLSRNTQKSYRDAIRLLLRFIAKRYGINPTHLTVEDVTAEVVRNFLTYLEKEQNSQATVNQRLTAIRSLFRFISHCVPELVDLATQVEAVPLRKTVVPTISYLEKKEMDAFLATPDRRRLQGQRDYALLLFLYNTGARASEAAQLTVGDLDLGTSPFVRILGKGRKIRLCPLWPHTAKTLRALLGRRLEGPREAAVFLNVRGAPITRFGIHTLVERIAERASKQMPSLQGKRVSPHVIRHSTACHLLRAGVDINTIRDWLGHVSLETTNVYAKVDLEMKAKALATCAVTGPGQTPPEEASWRNDRDLMAFLNSL